MPRKPRIEYEDAVYHVLNRGNYQDAVFLVGNAGQVFEGTMFDACRRFGWILYAYVVMSNHYHLALKTPEPNLVKGMQWFQSTFGNRFNRLIRKRGHVFQGRYKTLLLEDRGYLLRVVNYIHLNPVRAGIVKMEDLRTYQLSSFPKFFRKQRPAFLVSEDWLALAGSLRATTAGMKAYHRYLSLSYEHDPEKRKEMHRELCRGWYVGTRDGKKALLQDVAAGHVGGDTVNLKRFGDEGAETLLAKGLLSLGKSETDLENTAKGAEWKVVLASWIKSKCGVSNQWLSTHMYMGSMYYVSRLVCEEKKRPKGRRKLWRQLKSAKR